MHKSYLLTILVLLIVPCTIAATDLTTTVTVDIYGRTTIQYTFNSALMSADLPAYSPESIDSPIKYSIQNDTLHVTNVPRGTTITYLSSSFAKKDGLWKISYEPRDFESVKIILPFSAHIKTSTGSNVRSKDRLGQSLEWESPVPIELTYDIGPQKNSISMLQIGLIISIIALVAIIYRQRQALSKKDPDLFMQRMRGIHRPIVRKVIYAILVRTYDKEDRIIDQLDIRNTLSKTKVNGIPIIEKGTSHKSEISEVVKKRLNWLIQQNESKISVLPSAEEEYDLRKNAKRIITLIEKEGLLGKEQP
ncbi:hypothetical protein C4580_02015 [Candidatus Woesearchaeota archaeon]|nr:MAG: hypothetical protein C4580_02015 [Candidatus Woesearchaeota archaeon]